MLKTRYGQSDSDFLSSSQRIPMLCLLGAVSLPQFAIKPTSLSVASFANIFSHSEGCLFVLFMVSFAVQKLLSFIRSYLFIFVLISISLGGGSKRILL